MSIVVPTIDTRELTLRCVDAVLASRLPDGVALDVVVVDDGSRDGTAEALARRPGVRVVRNETPTGFARAANRGAAEAKGDVCVFLNSDAELDAGSLAAMVAAFDSEERLGIAGAALRYPDGTPQWSAGREPGLSWLFAQASGLPALLGRLPGWRKVVPLHAAGPAEVGWVSGAVMAVRAAVWRDHGPLETSYAFYVQDLDFCLRAREGGWRVRLLPAFRAVHLHGATIASDGTSPIGNTDLGLLWSDLTLWAARRKGGAAGRRARAAILAAASLRVFARSLAFPFVPPSRRGRWRAETAALKQGVRTLCAASGTA